MCDGHVVIFIMSNRVQKPAHPKTRERALLATAIQTFGLPADMPCTPCFKAKKECFILPGGRSSRCDECARSGRRCDGVLVASNRERSSRFFLFLLLTFLAQWKN
jgi:hypothetical protein